MSPPAHPTILLIQGSFQRPDVYSPFVKLLESRGFGVVQPELPSLTGQDQPDFPQKTLADDSAVIEAALQRLVQDEAKKVVVVMHSYGGLVGAEAVPEELTLSSREHRGLLAGGVAHFIYVAAFVMPPGQSIGAAMRDSPNHTIEDGRIRMLDPRALIYNDLPPEEAASLVDRMTVQSAGVLDTVLTRCAYSYVPSTYVVCTADPALPPPVQERFAQAAGSEVKNIAAGHSPMLSKPEQLANIIVEISEGV
ncbi:alpha/beta-hydrolase [Cryphonectria parasitica EP155]|uniref:Alpha/beta-hydrolase n=1 Tax=Cryphonectria parasitica (strain ATCC 38755 / EP155) TaxID=660469 RepID=A0A9P4XUI5_CRYP1|nr:alpha/beta-hydrolase [Cryphonectria parasitica EP155]KAF3761066.1 alpha/beta-hydrolase [Cryphonectria parasitica EP155]